VNNKSPERIFSMKVEIYFIIKLFYLYNI